MSGPPEASPPLEEASPPSEKASPPPEIDPALVLAAPPPPEAEALLEQARAGALPQAHRLARRLSAQDPAATIPFDLLEAAGRRGARRLLRRIRRERSAAAPGHLQPAALGPLEAWAHFRLWRHGRALALAAGRLPQASAEEAERWWEALEAIRRSALRQGYLRLAQRAHHLAVQAAEATPATALRTAARTAARAVAAQEMEALRWLLDHHREHDLPPALTRYLARSLGPPTGDCKAAVVEMARDLRLTPAHLASARALARRLGMAARVEDRLAGLESRLFHGRWERRRRAQRWLLGLWWGLVLLGVVFGVTLVRHGC